MDRQAELLPCPFCGARPHRGLGKVQHDQLHGEPFQRAWIRCPSGHASFDCMTEQMAADAWNTRQSSQLSELRKAAEGMAEALAIADDAIREMFRYYDGGETRGSYDGRPERNQLRKAGYVTRTALSQYRRES